MEINLMRVAELIGVFLVVIGILTLIYTSNVFISQRGRRLVEKYSEGEAESLDNEDLAEARHAYLNLRIVRFARGVIVIGILIIAVGIFF